MSKRYTTPLTVRLPIDLYQLMSDVCSLERCSIRSFVETALRQEFDTRLAAGGGQLIEVLRSMSDCRMAQIRQQAEPKP